LLARDYQTAPSGGRHLRAGILRSGGCGRRRPSVASKRPSWLVAAEPLQPKRFQCRAGLRCASLSKPPIRRKHGLKCYSARALRPKLSCELASERPSGLTVPVARARAFEPSTGIRAVCRRGRVDAGEVGSTTGARVASGSHVQGTRAAPPSISGRTTTRGPPKSPRRFLLLVGRPPPYRGGGTEESWQ
jgi:hypothetical protein